MAKRDVIAIEGLEVDCVVGVYPARRRDRLRRRCGVDLYMECDTRRAGEHERLRESLDCAAVASQVTLPAQTCRFGMLEPPRAYRALLLAPSNT